MRLTPPARFAAMLTLAILPAFSQATTSSNPASGPTPCAANVTYEYFAEAGISYGTVASTTSGFGLRFGCSNAFLVTDIDSTIGVPASAYSTLRVGIEYVPGCKAGWCITAFASPGATTAGAVSFAGGGGLQYDVGSALTKGKFGLLLNAQVRITAVPNAPSNAVSRGLSFMLRKTF